MPDTTPTLEELGASIEDLVEERFRIADEIAGIQLRHKAELAPLEALQKEIEVSVLDYLNRHPNAKHIAAQAGKAERDTKQWLRVTDWPTFIKYVIESNQLGLLKKDVASTAAYEIEKVTGSLPPGLTPGAEAVVSFTRARKRTSKT